MNNWGLLLGAGGFFIFLGLIFAIQEHDYFRKKINSILTFIGWNVFIPLGIILYILSIIGIVLKIIFLCLKLK
jgi:hypothetical protein